MVGIFYMFSVGTKLKFLVTLGNFRARKLDKLENHADLQKKYRKNVKYKYSTSFYLVFSNQNKFYELNFTYFPDQLEIWRTYLNKSDDITINW